MCYCIPMANETGSRYIYVTADNNLRERIREIAERERRTMPDQGAMLIELGLEAYERIERERQAILAGQTQIDMAAFGR